MAEDACWLAVQAMLFFRCERGLMALGVNGEVISQAYALGTARTRSLCYACMPTWVFVWASTWMHVCVCLPTEATYCRSAWLTAKNMKRSKHLGTLAEYNQNSECVDTALPAALLQEMAPSWPTNNSRTIKPESKKKKLMLNSILLTFSWSSMFHAFPQASNQAMCLES